MKPKFPKKRSRIALVDKHPVVLKGLYDIFLETKDLQVCGKAHSVGEARKMLASCRPDLVVIDLFRGAMGLELISELRSRDRPVYILVFSAKQEAFYAERAFRAGADGYVTKDESPSEILRAARALLKGAAHVSERIRHEMLHETGARHDLGHALVRKLSDREFQVFQLLGEGFNPRQIAGELGGSPKTVETYCLRIRKKLGLASGYDLLRLAIQWRIGTCD